MAQREIDIQFPVAGIDRAMPFQLQPPYTTPDAENVWPVTGTDSRQHGGSRSGILPIYLLSDNNVFRPVQALVSSPDQDAEYIGALERFDRPEMGNAWSKIPGTPRELQWYKGCLRLTPESGNAEAGYLYNMRHWLGPDDATYTPADHRLVSTFFIRLIPDGGRLNGILTVDYPWVEEGVGGPGFPEGFAAQRVVVNMTGSSVTVTHYRRRQGQWHTGGQDSEGHWIIYSLSGLPIDEMAVLRLGYACRPESVVSLNGKMRYFCWWNGTPLFSRTPGLVPPGGWSRYDAYPGLLEESFPSGATLRTYAKNVMARITASNSGPGGALLIREVGFITSVPTQISLIDVPDVAREFGSRAPRPEYARAVSGGKLFQMRHCLPTAVPVGCRSWVQDEGGSNPRNTDVTYNAFSHLSGPIMACNTPNGAVFADHDPYDFVYPYGSTPANIEIGVVNIGDRKHHYVTSFGGGGGTPYLWYTGANLQHPYNFWARSYGLLISDNPDGFNGTMAITSWYGNAVEQGAMLASPARDISSGTYRVNARIVRLPKVHWGARTLPKLYGHDPALSDLDLQVTQLGALRFSDVGRPQTPDICCGSVPYNCPIVAEFGGRVYFAGQPDTPSAWYGCRINNIFDWDYGQDDAAAAIAGSLAEEGAPPEPITALIPSGDDYMLIAGLRRTLIMRGNISAGGMIGVLSHEIGCVGRLAWCRDDSGNVYMLSQRGLAVVPNGAQARPVALSKGRMPRDLVGMSSVGYEPMLVWDSFNGGVWIFMFGRRTYAASQAWFYDVATQSFWPMKFPEHWSITSAISHSDLCFGGERIWIGTSNGYVGVLDPEARTDMGTPINSRLVIGPLRPSASNRDGSIDYLDVSMADWSTAVTLEVSGGQTGEAACDFPQPLNREDSGRLLTEDGRPIMRERLHNADYDDIAEPLQTATVIARGGPNHRYHPRVRGAFLALRFSNCTSRPWGFGSVVAGVSDAGQTRVP